MTRLFVSHASEDKDEFVRPLADALRLAGFQVWYDEYQLRVGMSIRQEIDRGLREADFGVVVFSRHFFEKNWTNQELSGLMALENEHRKMILPVWHKVGRTEVAAYSPMLADRVAATGRSIDAVVEAIASAVQVSNRTRAVVAPDETQIAIASMQNSLLNLELDREVLSSPSAMAMARSSLQTILKTTKELIAGLDSANGEKRFYFKDGQDGFHVSGPFDIQLQVGFSDVFVNTARYLKVVATVLRPRIDSPRSPLVTLGQQEFKVTCRSRTELAFRTDHIPDQISEARLAELVVKRYCTFLRDEASARQRSEGVYQ